MKTRTNKTAFVTGITGQDGGYLAELLLDEGYEVHALRRRSAGANMRRIDHILDNPNLHLHYGDLTDTGCLMKLFSTYQFDEVYNLGAQSHVRVSFDIPEYTADVDGLGTLRLLECIRTLGMMETTRFYQASTSELYGQVQEVPQTETTPFYPRSPYGVAKLFSYWTVKNYREAYGLHGSNGILFNHESPWRGDEFVTQKIVKGVVDVISGKKDKISLGNLDAQRDWGHAKDYVEAMWLMLQQEHPNDYVVSTGEQHSVREFVSIACEHIGFNIEWSGTGIDEVATIKETGEVLVRVNPDYYRPTEVDSLVGDPTFVKNEIGWEPKYSFTDLVKEMCDSDMEASK